MEQMPNFNNSRRGNFIGHDGFIWWIGVVENRMDPLDSGRCQVRIKGLHTDNKSLIPTSQLPWSQPLFPVNSSFCTPTTLKEGDMVFGFFMDGDQAQYPIIVGAFHGIPEDKANPSKGFNDPRSTNELKAAPRTPEQLIYNKNGSGITINEKAQASLYPLNLNEPTIDRLTRNEQIQQTIVATKKASVVTVSSAVSGNWTEPTTPYNAKYPYNKVIATESGHFFELDDTPGKERTHLYHRSGTFVENHPDGSQVEKITKNKYSIVMKDDHVYIMGKCQITVQGDAEVYVQKNCYLKTDGNLDFKVAGNWTTNVSGRVTHRSGGDTVIRAPAIRLN